MAVDPFSAAISLVSIGSNVANGLNAMSAGKAQEQQAKMVAEDQRIQGMQRDTARLEDYYATIGSIEAIRAARGMSFDSPTGQAIDKAITGEATRNRQNEGGTYARMRAQTLLSGRIARQQSMAQAMGYFSGAAKSMFSLGQDIAG